MIFINLWEEAPEFEEYVGEALDVFKDVMGTEPLEVFHLHRSTIHANWKQLHEVSIEQYHEYMHFLNRRVAMGSEGYNRFWRFYKNGHVMLEPMTQDYTRVKGLGERSQGMLPGMKPGEFRLVGLFPDTIVVCRSTVLRIDTLNPIAPNLSVLESRGLGIKGESPKDRAMRVKHHNQYWGPFGRNAPEDALIP